MDLIANSLAFILSLIAGVVGNIVAHDMCAMADVWCNKIIHRAAMRLADFDQADTEQEWLGDLAERETVHAKYYHAIGCYFAAPRMRRQAKTVVIDVNFKIAAVGVVPLTIIISPNIGVPILRRMTSTWTRKMMIAVVIVYYYLKVLIAAHRLGPGRLPLFLGAIKEFKKWELDVRVRRKGGDLDFSQLVKLFVLDRDKGQKALQAVADILARKPNG